MITVNNRSPEAVAMLKLGSDLGEFINNAAWGGSDFRCPGRQALAFIFERLASIGDIQLLAEGLKLYNDLTAQRAAKEQQARNKSTEEYAEQSQRHQLAITVELAKRLLDSPQPVGADAEPGDLYGPP